MKSLIAAAAIGAAITLPSLAIAQTAPMATEMICHPAQSGQMSNANMQDTKLVCRPMNVARVRAAMKTMMAMPNLTPDQMLQMQALMDEIQLEPEIPGGNGNATDPGAVH